MLKKIDFLPLSHDLLFVVYNMSSGKNLHVCNAVNELKYEKLIVIYHVIK